MVVLNILEQNEKESTRGPPRANGRLRAREEEVRVAFSLGKKKAVILKQGVRDAGLFWVKKRGEWCP